MEGEGNSIENLENLEKRGYFWQKNSFKSSRKTKNNMKSPNFIAKWGLILSILECQWIPKTENIPPAQG